LQTLKIVDIKKQLISRSGLLQKLIVSQLVKKFSSIYGAQH